MRHPHPVCSATVDRRPTPVGTARVVRILGGIAIGLMVALAPVQANGALASEPTATTPNAAIVSLSAAAGVTAALRATPDGRHLQLLVGTGDMLQPAVGIPPFRGTSESYPRVNVGTDVDGSAVLIYPRCKNDAVAGEICDLYRMDPVAGTERLIPGIRRARRSEYEGVMQNGALAFAAWQQTTDAGKAKDASGLWYRPVGGTPRRLARNGGWDLALRGRRVAHMIADGGKDNGEEPCTNSTLVLRGTGGSARVVARMCVLFNAVPEWRSPAFYADGLIWAWHNGRKSVLLRYDLRTRSASEASMPAETFGFHPTGANAGLALVRPVGEPVPDYAESTATAVQSVVGIRWKPRKLALIKKVPFVVEDPLG